MNKITQKRVCGECLALNFETKSCTLRYSVDTGIKNFVRYGRVKPNEPCPKPLTNTQFISELGRNKTIEKNNQS